MRVVLILAALLLVAASAVPLAPPDLAPATLVPAVAPYLQYLPQATLGLAALVLLLALIVAFTRPRARALPETAEPEALPPPEPPRDADAEVVHFLGMLQEKGRLVDFLMDDINPYSDAQVGAAARVVHGGCKGVLEEHFSIQPVRTEAEGSKVQVPAGYAAGEYRLVGRIAGAAPFSGVLVHRGWKTDKVKLPQLLRGADDPLPAIAPAEVEVK
jgi:hypothetical protein